MIIEIDKQSGFCFGVKRAVDQAEKLMENQSQLYSLGEMVHNHEEVERLQKRGMTTVTHEQLDELRGKTVLFRSHGEPPETYEKAKESGICVVDATCPVVLKLQQRVKKSYQEMAEKDGQVVIFGKKDHPETIGLNGQTGYKALIVSDLEELENIDFNKPIELFSQTTMPVDGFNQLVEAIQQRAKHSFYPHDTICRQVANRLPRIGQFAKQYDLILFVAGKSSSNGKMLYNESLRNNKNTRFISKPEEIDQEWLTDVSSVGICGATSTPNWQLELVADYLKQILNITG